VHREGKIPSMGEIYRRDVGDPWKLKRWDWWKHRLAELAADADTETKQRVAKALASMEAAEAQPSKVGEEMRKNEGDGKTRETRKEMRKDTRTQERTSRNPGAGA